MKREELVAVLKAVMVGVDVKKSSDGFDIFVFNTDLVKTFNYNISVSHPCATGVDCAVKADSLFTVLSKMEGEEVSIKLDNQKLVVTDGKTTLKLSIIEDLVSAHMEALKLDELEWKPLPKDFIHGLSLVAFSAAKDITFGSLNGVGISNEGLFSSDNWRASWFKIKSKIEQFVIPVASAFDICKFENHTHYALSNECSWFHVRNKDGVIISCRLLTAEDFPFDGIKTFFTDKKGKKYKFPDGIEKTLERTGSLAMEDRVSGESFISIWASNGKLICQGVKEFGEVTEELTIKKDSFPAKAKLDISHRFLQEVLPKSKEFLFDDKVIVFELENFEHLITTIEV